MNTKHKQNDNDDSDWVLPSTDNVLETGPRALHLLIHLFLTMNILLRK